MINHRGIIDYASVLARLHGEPMTVADLCAAFNWHPKSMIPLMRGMLWFKLVHIAGWTSSRHGVPPQPMFKAGEGIHAPAPRVARNFSKSAQRWLSGRSKPCVTLITLATVVRGLKAKPMCRTQLAIESGIGTTPACRLMRAMHQMGLIHIELWEKARAGQPVAFYSWGAGRDAARPPRASSQHHAAVRRARRAALQGVEIDQAAGVRYTAPLRVAPTHKSVHQERQAA